MDTFTAITLSKEPISGKVPEGVAQINEVSVFTTLAGDYAARLRAIRKVKTSHFFFIDADDTYVDQCWPSTTLTVGTEYRQSVEMRYCIPRRPPQYKAENHLRAPQYVHNATCINTQEAWAVLELMPSEGEYYFQHMFYFLLAQRGPVRTEPRLEYRWNVSSTGMHNQAREAIVNTQRWLLERFG